MVVWWCFCGGVFVVVWWCFCDGVFVVVFVVFLWWCGAVFVVVFLCFCGGVFVFLWWYFCAFVVMFFLVLGVDFCRITEKFCKECWQHWCKKMFGLKFSFHCSYPHSHQTFPLFNYLHCFRDIRRLVVGASLVHHCCGVQAL